MRQKIIEGSKYVKCSHKGSLFFLLKVFVELYVRLQYLKCFVSSGHFIHFSMIPTTLWKIQAKTIGHKKRPCQFEASMRTRGHMSDITESTGSTRVRNKIRVKTC